jgi:hypothetical protein
MKLLRHGDNRGGGNTLQKKKNVYHQEKFIYFYDILHTSLSTENCRLPPPLRDKRFEINTDSDRQDYGRFYIGNGTLKQWRINLLGALRHNECLPPPF